MGWSRSSGKLLLIASYAILSLVPFAPMLAGRPVHHPGAVALAELLLWASLWAVFARPAYFHWLLLPAFLALPMELYVQWYFNQSLSAHHVGIMVETTPAEAMEFIGNQGWAMAAAFVAVALWWLLCLMVARQADGLAWRGITRWAFLMLAAALTAVNACSALKLGDGPLAEVRILGLGDLKPLLDMANRDGLARTRPFGLTTTVLDYHEQRRDLSRMSRGAEGFSFQARQHPSDGRPEVVLVVIGESSRFDRWRLNGYVRDTTPLLAQESNLITLADVVSPVSVTRLSVPVLATRKPAREALTLGFHEKSFVSAFREAGFHTWWLSNQLTYGEHDTPFAAFPQEAHEVRHLNLGGYYEQSSYDGALLAPLQRALTAPERRKLVVLHTLGNHWNYARRYPPAFDHWRPSLTGVEQPVLGDPNQLELASNSYDNSIRYTDWFLAQAIGMLKRSGQRAVLVYVSDHGEVLRDAQCQLYLHGHGTQHEHHVPAFVWYSDQYRARYPAKVAALERHRAKRLGTQDVFHTLLDLVDIRYPGERLEWSFAYPGYTPRPRIVANDYWAERDNWVDYDAAQRQGACGVLARALPSGPLAGTP